MVQLCSKQSGWGPDHHCFVTVSVLLFLFMAEAWMTQLRPVYTGWRPSLRCTVTAFVLLASGLKIDWSSCGETLDLLHTGDSRYGGKRQRQTTAKAERQIHATNVCTRTLATHVHSSSARAVPYMAKPRRASTNRQNGFIQRVLRLRR